jgi:two-component system, NtrC family, sensor kinase
MKNVLSEAMNIKADLATEINSPRRYQLLRRKIVSLMALVTILPLVSLAGINYYEHQSTMAAEIQAPLRALVGKAKHSFELFLAERTSAVSFIASAYSFDELSNDTNLQRIFQVMRREFTGFVDLGLIDTAGNQISYAGPYDLKDRNYTSQSWFHQVQFKGTYVSDVFMGFRKFPHVVIAVRHTSENGQSWILRATLDTMHFDRIIGAMGLEPGSDAFLVNRDGILQTESRRYGKVLDMLPFGLPPTNFESNVQTLRDDKDREIFLASAFIADTDFALAAIKPKPTVFSTWYTVRADLLVIFVSGVVAIFLAVYRLTSVLIKRLQESDEQRMGRHPPDGALPEAVLHRPPGRRRGSRNQQSPGHHQREGRAHARHLGVASGLSGQGQVLQPDRSHPPLRGTLPGHHPPHARLCEAHGRQN